MTSYPDWLPVPVIAWIEANRDHPEHVARADLIHQIAADPRGKVLWSELTKRKPNGFVYPVQRTAIEGFCDPPIPTDETERHGIGLIFVFKQLLHIAISVHAAKSEAQRAQQAEDMRRRAAWLRTEADDTDLIPNGAGEIDWRMVAAGMRAKADVLQQAADALGVYHLVVPHERENMTGIATALRISTVTETVFGKPLYRQSAALAEMLTGEAVTIEQVRDLRRNHKVSVNFRPRRR
ncbi:hypothetical protein [Acidiphilium sp.]|uniref:hypothetical protein n=1 Tax=Acidiphilium sp. TaxID=527 RepID=UPI003D090644